MVVGRARPASPQTLRSPRSQSRLCNDATVSEQLLVFLDDWYFRVLDCSLAKEMSRRETLQTLLDVLEMAGMRFSYGEKENILNLGEDDAVISAIVTRMPMAMKEQWEHVALLLQSVVHSATRLRKAAELKGENADASVAGVFEESSDDSISQQILKCAVVFSAKNVTRLRKIHVSWRKNTDARIERMIAMQADAERATQELLALESQLSHLGASAKDNGKSILLKMAAGNENALKHSVFSTWHGLVMKEQAEKDIRNRFETRLNLAETKFFDMKVKQVQNVRSVMARLCFEEEGGALRDAWSLWAAEVRIRKADGDTTEELKRVQAKLAEFSNAAAENAKKVMTRLAGAAAGALLAMCFQAWLDWGRSYRQEQEMEDAVKKTEQKLKKLLDSKKDETREIMERMTGCCSTGLLSLMLQYWIEYVKEEKNAREMYEAVNGQDHKFKSLTQKQRMGTRNVQHRINEQVNMNLLQRVFSNWILETKVNGINLIFSQKYTTKKKQLQGVQNLFKSFAVQLEQNLGVDDDDYSARGASSTGRQSDDFYRSSNYRKQNKNKGASRQRGMARETAGSTSLPDIHGRSRQDLLM